MKWYLLIFDFIPKSAKWHASPWKPLSVDSKACKYFCYWKNFMKKYLLIIDEFCDSKCWRYRLSRVEPLITWLWDTDTRSYYMAHQWSYIATLFVFFAYLRLCYSPRLHFIESRAYHSAVIWQPYLPNTLFLGYGFFTLYRP